LVDRFSAYNFGGKRCPACGFPAGMLYVETCRNCYGSLIFCPKCRQIQCWGSQPTGIRTGEDDPKDLASKWRAVKRRN